MPTVALAFVALDKFHSEEIRSFGWIGETQQNERALALESTGL